MSNVRFIADLHFGHKSMAIHRGFKDEFEHDEHIIKRWNEVVKKKDTTYILGDITMETTKWYFYLDQLNGRKIVVLGNHDMPNHTTELLKYVDKVCGMVKYSQKGYLKAFLTHCPIHESELEYRVGYNIHGHIHEKQIMLPPKLVNNKVILGEPDSRYVCVSCEQVDYQPKLFTELIPEWNKNQTKD